MTTHSDSGIPLMLINHRSVGVFVYLFVRLFLVATNKYIKEIDKS